MGKVGNIDYDLVEEKSHTLIKERSKDIRVLSFLSYVYLRNENWEAFSDIFDGLSQLAGQDYNALFPERPRARQMAFKWLSEKRYTDTIEIKKPTEDVYDHTKRLVESLTKIKQILEKEFPEGSPFPSGLYSIAQKWEKTTKPKPAPATPAVSSDGETVAPSKDQTAGTQSAATQAPAPAVR